MRPPSVVTLATVTFAACATAPAPCRYTDGRGTCPICRTDETLRREGEVVAVPSLRKRPDPQLVPFWSGASLPAQVPDPALYVRCRPCSCGASGELEPWSEWEAINAAAYVRLRQASAPYPVAIVPGFHAGGFVARYRLKIALRLLARGWVAALVLSGGHRRGGVNEALDLYEEARRLAAALKVDVRDRLLIEPCACHTTTNLRNSLRLMAAFGLPHGLLVSDAQMTGQAALFAGDLDAIADQDLRCAVGRVSYVLGYTPLVRFSDEGNGCRAPFSWSNNPVAFAFPNKRLAVFWVSPTMQIAGEQHSALECGPGSRALLDCEPDNQDATLDGCLPLLGHTDRLCTPRP